MSVYKLQETARPLPGDLFPSSVGTYRGRAALTLAKHDPEKALGYVRALPKLDGGQVALRAGDAALLLANPALARRGYDLARRRFHSYGVAGGAWGEACARYGLALVAYGLGDCWQALGEIDAALEGIRFWVMLRDNGLDALLEALGDMCLTRLPLGDL